LMNYQKNPEYKSLGLGDQGHSSKSIPLDIWCYKEVLW
jgi:hypothetical protein